MKLSAKQWDKKVRRYCKRILGSVSASPEEKAAARDALDFQPKRRKLVNLLRKRSRLVPIEVLP